MTVVIAADSQERPKYTTGIAQKISNPRVTKILSIQVSEGGTRKPAASIENRGAE